jgi:hypothetical protein
VTHSKFAVSLGVLFLAAPVHATDHPQAANKLMLSSNATSGKGKLSWMSKTPPLVAPASDPRAVGATLRVIGLGGDVTVQLPASMWWSDRGSYGFTNRAAPSAASPVELVKLTVDKKLSLVAKASIIPLDGPREGTVSVILTVGGDAYCSTCTSPLRDQARKYVAKGCFAPADCSGASPAPPGASGFPRGMYENNDGAHNSLFQSLGFTAVNVEPSRSALDALVPLGLHGMVWIGDYNDSTCRFDDSDATIASEVDAIQGHPAILGYYVADEPEQALENCPSVASDIAARSQLVRQHDPSRPTYAVISNSAYIPGHTIEYYPYHYFVGAVDLMGLDIYPCLQPAGTPCDFADIDRAIAAADAQRVPHYLAVVQDFMDSTWRRPTPAEVTTQFDHWANSRMEGYFIFSWDWAGNSLDGDTAQQSELRTENARAFAGSGTTTTTTTPVHGTTTTTSAGVAGADEVHWTITGPTSVTFDWRGQVSVIQSGTTTSYGSSVTAQTPSIVPFSSPGPFRQARITGLQPNTVYHYSLGTNGDHTFKTPPAPGSSGFTVYAAGDIGSSLSFPSVAPIQAMIAAAHPDIVLPLGDLTYGNDNGQADVDQHFNDVMAWSLDSPYEAVWGNHEWDESTDDLRNYKGRFDFANPQTDPASPSVSCCGEDWHWFDYGNTRFIAYPEPWDGDDWAHWRSLVSNSGGTGIMDLAQANPNIRFIVTFGHRPAWSTGYHAGDSTLAQYMHDLRATHSKYVLNLNGHSHDYERSDPTKTDGVTHVTSGTGGGLLEPVNSSGCLWQVCPPPAWSVKRYMHYGVLRLVFGASSISGQFICGPAGGGPNDVSCNVGDVIDSFTVQ